MKKELNEDIIWAYALKNALEHKGYAKTGSVIPGLFAAGLDKRDVKKIMPKVNSIVKEVNDMGDSLKKARFKEVEKYIGHRPEKEPGELPDLPNAKQGKVVMRIAPSPSGPLHLMHAINTSLNYLFVEKYKGRLYVRIEDTNPENIYPPAYEMIKKEADWLTDKKGIIMIQSDRMDLYYKYAEKLLKKKAAYVCDCDNEGFKELIKKQIECPCRLLLKKDPKEVMNRWKRMLDKSKNGYKEGEAVLRFKADLKNPNPALRDFPLARINETKHPRQGQKYRVWPLMNLAVTVDDIETKMTHIIRGKDHKDNAKRQEMIYKVLDKKMPWIAFTGMTNFTDMKFSTRQMREDIEKGKYKGWDDPRLPTVASLKKRGYSVEAFRKMAAHTASFDEVDKVISKKDFFELLDRFNEE